MPMLEHRKVGQIVRLFGAGILLLALMRIGVQCARSTTGSPNRGAILPATQAGLMKSLEEKGRDRAAADIKAGRLRILYYGLPWSMGKPLIDDESGLAIEIVEGCDVMPEFKAETDAYNASMRQWAKEHPATSPDAAWSKPADGLRMRLVGPESPVIVGQRFQIKMLIQNVSAKPIAIREPHFLSVIRDPGAHPGNRDAAHWNESVITTTWPHRQEQGFLWHSDSGSTMLTPRTVQPKEIHTVLLIVGRDDQERPQDGIQPETIMFLYHDIPGKYPLVATYAVPAGDPPAWSGNLVAPMVDVELLAGPATRPAVSH